LYNKVAFTPDALQYKENVVSLAEIYKICIWRHWLYRREWHHMRILTIYAMEKTYSVQWRASGVSNLIIQPWF